jgi:phosphomannomutase
MTLTCFKAYDVRGRLGLDLDEAIAYRIGRAFAEELRAKSIVIGHDSRASSLALAAAVTRGMTDAGVHVLDLGLAGTEEVYFATTDYNADGGIEITASHNPVDYNGMKIVGRGSAPIGPDTGLAAIRARAESQNFNPDISGGTVTPIPNARAAYVARVLSFIDIAALRPLKILVNAGNGTAGPTFDAIAAALAAQGAPLTFHRMHHNVDGSFPNGIPNPLLPENQPVTAAAVIAHEADMGVAWDGDFDRCFFFDHNGRFIPGEYIVGLLAQAFLLKHPGSAVVHDPRIIWNTQDAVAAGGGRAVQTRTGHAYLKQSMRDEGAIYGGEMSAHHYFRDFVHCDSGMIPWLVIAELISHSGRSLADLVEDRMARFPSSGEINFTLTDPKQAIARVVAAYRDQATDIDEMDGIGLSFPDWRFNLRSSNTEPVVRLNVESRGDAALVTRQVAAISALLTQP